MTSSKELVFNLGSSLSDLMMQPDPIIWWWRLWKTSWNSRTTLPYSSAKQG